MFNLKDAIPDLTTDYILSRISEEQIWSTYCGNFTEINRGFCSELYNDRNPDCRVYYNSKNRLVYKDFGTGDTFDCFSYIQKKYNCTFREALIIIYNDFKLGSMTYDIIPQLVLNNAPEVLKMANKSIIEIVPKSWSLVDYNIWNAIGITLEDLDEEEVICCETVYLHKDNRTITYNSSKSNPIYAYKEYDIDLNFLGYKIYFPLAQVGYKWLNSSSSEAIQGIKSITRSGGLLIIGKSRKDCICYKKLGIEAIAPYNESGDLDVNRIVELFDYYDQVVINFDPDDAGVKATLKLASKYKLPYFYIDEGKDLSGFIKIHGLDEAKKMINNKLEAIYG